jgi:hypothetical protein
MTQHSALLFCNNPERWSLEAKLALGSLSSITDHSLPQGQDQLEVSEVLMLTHLTLSTSASYALDLPYLVLS